VPFYPVRPWMRSVIAEQRSAERRIRLLRPGPKDCHRRPFRDWIGLNLRNSTGVGVAGQVNTEFAFDFRYGSQLQASSECGGSSASSGAARATKRAVEEETPSSLGNRARFRRKRPRNNEPASGFVSGVWQNQARRASARAKARRRRRRFMVIAARISATRPSVHVVLFFMRAGPPFVQY